MMALITMLCSKSKELDLFEREIRTKLIDGDFLEYPFTGWIHSRDADLLEYGEKLVVLSITPKYPPVYYVGLLFGALFVVFGWTWAAVVGTLLSLPALLWSPFFYRLMFHLGLRKKGHKGKLKHITAKKAIERMFS